MHHPIQCAFFLDMEATAPCPHQAVRTAWSPFLQMWLPCCAHCGNEAPETREGSE